MTNQLHHYVALLQHLERTQTRAPVALATLSTRKRRARRWPTP